MLSRLYRVIVRQRLTFTPGSDASVPEKIKPGETEGTSVERDITSFVKSYKISNSKESLSSEATIVFLNDKGELTPENHTSSWNISPIDSVSYAPLLAEGNEVQIYRITSSDYLDASYRTDSTKWVPRFRGMIRNITFGTDSGYDTLELTVGDVLSRASKCNMTGTFSPMVRSSSVIPSNHYFDLATMTSAVSILRNVDVTSCVTKEDAAFICPPTKAEAGMMPAGELAHLIYWDRDDTFFTLGKDIPHMPRFKAENDDGTKISERSASYLAVDATTTVAVFNLNGYAWYVSSGTVTKDAAKYYTDTEGSLKLTDATLVLNTRKVPAGLPSVLRFAFLAESSGTVRITITRRTFNRSTLAYVTANDTLVADTGAISGPTSFSASELGGTLLNAPESTNYEWRNQTILLDAIDPKYFTSEDETKPLQYEVKIVTTGTIWLDAPRWEFTYTDIAKDKLSDGVTDNPIARTVVSLDSNLLNLPAFERWTTKDGILYTDPYPSHCSLVQKNTMVVVRNLRAPYVAGTDEGYGPTHLRLRSLPENYLYQRELVPGQDFEVMQDKGGIQLSSAFTRSEVFVAHGYYDLDCSSHMEASNLISFLLQKGCGIPASKISIESSGVILSKVTLGLTSTQTIASAIQDIIKQVPGNFFLMTNGSGDVIGKFVQQDGSPRIYNPITQVPITPLNSSILARGKEFWYGITALMSDGKETLLSNMLSTVDYNNYYDSAHESLVTGGVCPALFIKPVPNMLGLVIRRAEAYKPANESVSKPAVTAKYSWVGNEIQILKPVIGSAVFSDTSGAFDTYVVADLN